MFAIEGQSAVGTKHKTQQNNKQVTTSAVAQAFNDFGRNVRSALESIDDQGSALGDDAIKGLKKFVVELTEVGRAIKKLPSDIRNKILTPDYSDEIKLANEAIAKRSHKSNGSRPSNSGDKSL